MAQINLARLKKCMTRAKQGEELTIAFLGGSVTQGCLASKQENTYAYQVYLWWRKSFPKTDFQFVNGGIGGTTSYYGVSRVVKDVLIYQPDFVIVDFSVNDEPGRFFQETYEGVLRRLLQWRSKPAVLILNNVFYDTGENAEKYHNAVGNWYQVPHVSIRQTVYQRMKQGMYTRDELTEDGLHPNDKGHRLVAEEITTFLESVKTQSEEPEKENPFPAPMTRNAYENAERLTIQNCSPDCFGFRADAGRKEGYWDNFKNGWVGKKSGDRIFFVIEASCIAVQYRKTIQKPALQAKLILDGNKTEPILLDGNFTEDWGDCQYLQPVLNYGKKKRHTVEIEVLPEQSKEITPFYLMSLIIA